MPPVCRQLVARGILAVERPPSFGAAGGTIGGVSLKRRTRATQKTESPHRGPGGRGGGLEGPSGEGGTGWDRVHDGHPGGCGKEFPALAVPEGTPWRRSSGRGGARKPAGQVRAAGPPGGHRFDLERGADLARPNKCDQGKPPRRPSPGEARRGGDITKLPRLRLLLRGLFRGILDRIAPWCSEGGRSGKRFTKSEITELVIVSRKLLLSELSVLLTADSIWHHELVVAVGIHRLH